eukprot:3124736-Amphidinium_carterae.1
MLSNRNTQKVPLGTVSLHVLALARSKSGHRHLSGSENWPNWLCYHEDSAELWAQSEYQNGSLSAAQTSLHRL